MVFRGKHAFFLTQCLVPRLADQAGIWGLSRDSSDLTQPPSPGGVSPLLQLLLALSLFLVPAPTRGDVTKPLVLKLYA